MSGATAVGARFAVGATAHDIYTLDHWEPQIVDARNNSHVLTSLLSEETVDVAGRGYLFGTKTSRSNAVTTIRPGQGRLVDPRSQGGTLQGTFLKTWNARVKINQQLVDRQSKDQDTLLKAIDDEMTSIRDDLAVIENWTMYQDGSGRLAEVVSVSGTDITLRLNQDIPGNTTSTSTPTEFLEAGMRVAFVAADGSSGVVGQIVTISGNVITCSSTEGGAAANLSASISTGDWLVRASSFDSTSALDMSFKNDPMGIGGIFSTTNVQDGVGRFPSLTDAGSTRTGQTPIQYYGSSSGSWSFQGNDAASNSWNQAVVLSNSGVLRPLTEALIQEAFSESEKRNNAMVEMLLCSVEMRDTLADQLLPNKRFVNSTELRGGFTALDFNGHKLITDRHCQRNCIYGLALGTGGFRRIQGVPMHVDTSQGNVAWQRVPDYLDLVLNMYGEWQYVVDLRQRCGFKITDITEIR